MRRGPVGSEYRGALEEYGLLEVTHAPPELFRYKKGEYLCREGEALEYLLYVAQGRIKVSTTSGSGKTLLICFYSSEGIIGSIEALTGLPATATAQAVSDVVCVAVAIAPNKKTLQSSVPFLRYLNTVLSVMFARSSKNSAVNILCQLETRLCSYIALTQSDGLFREKLTETSELLGASYRHLLRTLEALCSQGVLRKEPEGYRVVDLPGLKARAEDYYAMTAGFASDW